MRWLFVGLSFLSLTLPAQAASLTVYTYDSFVSEWGPGAKVKEEFEKSCDCTLNWVSVGDAAVLLSRLRLEGDQTQADVVLGLDLNLTASAIDAGIVQPHNLVLPEYALPIEWTDSHFVPYDFGHFAVIYDSDALETPPASLEALLDYQDDGKLIVQDPRTSTPGLGFMLWIKSVYGEDAQDAWRRLFHSGRILTMTPGWSEAYGLFLNGEAPMVLSYTTSPAYHLIYEQSDRYRAIIFPEGHYLQVEVAGITAHAKNSGLARDFLEFIGTPAFQKIIPTGNWMFPVIDIGSALPFEFRDLPAPSQSLILDPQTVRDNRDRWIDELRAIGDPD